MGFYFIGSLVIIPCIIMITNTDNNVFNIPPTYNVQTIFLKMTITKNSLKSLITDKSEN